MIKNIQLIGAVLTCAVILSACQQKAEIAGPPILNGTWASADGIYNAEFNNGNFRAVANDTGNTLSTGKYIAISETNVRIEWVSQLSGAANKASCVKPSANKLDCTDQGGKSFSLIRNS